MNKKGRNIIFSEWVKIIVHRGAMGEKIEQAVSKFYLWCEKNSCTCHCPLKKSHAQPKGTKKHSYSRKLHNPCPPPLQKKNNNGPSLTSILSAYERFPWIPWDRHAFFSRQSYSSSTKAITPWEHFSRDHIFHATTLISNCAKQTAFD